MPTDDRKDTNAVTHDDATLSVDELKAKSVDEQTAAQVKGGDAVVGKANFDVFTVSKGIDTATPSLH